MNNTVKYTIIHLHYYEHDTIDEIYKFFDGVVSKNEINDVINMNIELMNDIINSQILSMNCQL